MHGPSELLEALESHAPALAPLIHADGALLDDVQARPLERRDDREAIEQAFDFEALDEADLHRRLRRVRHRAMVRIALREILGLADIDQTARELATVAGAALDAALRAHRGWLAARFGDAMRADGQPIPLTALGMGKLGGGELNFGSDVDLVFFYGTDEGQVGEGLDLSVHDFFTRLVRAVSRAIGEITEDGYVFRVDLRLRPEGSQGPLANSLASAERYYAEFGRTWERGALLRARPVAGDPTFGDEVLAMLAPFIFRRSVDPTLADAMHEMMAKTRRDLRVDEARDVKLGRGGIREAEFFVQTLQLIWGGQHRELRVANTIEGLRRLRALGLVTHQDAEALETAWALLRRIEHRIHMSTGYQTHDLPAEREPFARSLGFEDREAFEDALRSARAIVADLFDSLVDDPAGTGEHDGLGFVLDALEAASAGEDDADERLRAGAPLVVGDADPDEAHAHLRRLTRIRRGPFGVRGPRRLATRLLREVREAAEPALALRFLADFLARGGAGYTRALAEEPRLARRLIGLFGQSPTLAELLCGHPETLGAVFAGGSLPTPEEVERAHSTDRPREVEDFVAWLRRLRREQLLRIGLAWIGQELAPRDTQRALSRLADAQLAAATDVAWREITTRMGEPASSLVVVAMGKLGGGELGFTSDLDLLFLYSRDGETEKGRAHVEVLARVAQRTLRLLSQPDAEGPGYEVDTRLRPSGSQGLLVSSLAGFERYQRDRAEAWERQALLRARVVHALGADAEAAADQARTIIEQAAFGMGPPEAERMAELRRRMQLELAREQADRYHPKLGFGGLVDIEFLVQWLQMRHGSDPTVRQRHTLDAIDALRAAGSLSDADAEVLADGYRFFRRVEQCTGLLDPTGDGGLQMGGRRARAVTRALGRRERDGVDAMEVFAREWRTRAEACRALFERTLAPVGAPACWSGP